MGAEVDPVSVVPPGVGKEAAESSEDSICGEGLLAAPPFEPLLGILSDCADAEGLVSDSSSWSAPPIGEHQKRKSNHLDNKTRQRTLSFHVLRASMVMPYLPELVALPYCDDADARCNQSED